jgi:hypothetical protein
MVSSVVDNSNLLASPINADYVIPSIARNLLFDLTRKADSSAFGLGMTIFLCPF